MNNDKDMDMIFNSFENLELDIVPFDYKKEKTHSVYKYRFWGSYE